MDDATDFAGAKAAVLIGGRLLVLLRDNRPDIPWPDAWDFPGGGREGAETPEATLAREMEEEVGLTMGEAEVLWQAPFPSPLDPARTGWFFVLRFAPGTETAIILGEEGQGWALVDPQRYLRLPDAIPHLQARLQLWLDRAA